MLTECSQSVRLSKGLPKLWNTCLTKVTLRINATQSQCKIFLLSYCMFLVLLGTIRSVHVILEQNKLYQFAAPLKQFSFSADVSQAMQAIVQQLNSYLSVFFFIFFYFFKQIHIQSGSILVCNTLILRSNQFLMVPP